MTVSSVPQMPLEPAARGQQPKGDISFEILKQGKESLNRERNAIVDRMPEETFAPMGRVLDTYA